MISSGVKSQRSDVRDSILNDLIDELTARLQSGETVDIELLVADHPDHAESLRRLFPALQVLADLSRSKESNGAAPPELGSSQSGPLGDFQIIREVGRGGMGVVYEATQISLNRRVALKVLPFAATMDPKHLQRFHNEARAAASLHHEHIVPVHGVGCERGVHYYAMQFIEGETLAEIIGRASSRQADVESGAEHVGLTPRRSPETTPFAGLTTEPGKPKGRDFYRRVAELIADAADALEYAHSTGIVHRDVKPGNLMIDAAGKLWITDFGLARYGTDAGLTMTGDVIGTLRYMSPEQALAKHGLVDHRTDVYSLGATLYELLTGKPAVGGEDKQDVLRRIAFEERVSPRRFDKSISAELETITLKCLAMAPGDRYESTKELATDLRRFVEDKPIRARRPTLRQRLTRWARSHPGLMATAGLVAGLLVAVGWVWDRDKAQAERAAQTAAAEADELRDADRLPEALSVARRAADRLPRFGGDAALRRAIGRRVGDLQLLIRLEEARLEQTVVRTFDNAFDYERAAPLFEQAFLDYGVDVIHGDEQMVVEALRGRPIVVQLVGSFFEWRQIVADSAVKLRLSRLIEALDPDPRQLLSRVKRAGVAKDIESLKRLGAEAESNLPPPAVLTRLGMSLRGNGAAANAERLLRAGQQRYPADFWVNYQLAETLDTMGPTRASEAIRFFSVALALRPFCAAVQNNLGVALSTSKRHADAVEILRRLVELHPTDAAGHVNLGNSLVAVRRLAEAEEAYRRAIELKPDFSEAYWCLGVFLADLKRLSEAESAYRQAIKLKPTLVEPHIFLGDVLVGLNRRTEAEASYREAIKLKPAFGHAYCQLGNVLALMNRPSDALDAHRRAVELMPTNATVHNNLGNSLMAVGQLNEAEKSLRRAITLQPDFIEANDNLGKLLLAMNRKAEAIEIYRRNTELKPADAGCHRKLGLALKLAGRLKEAEAAYHRAIDLAPSDCEANWQLGLMLVNSGRPNEAEDSYRHAIKLKSDCAEGHLLLGWLLVNRKGQFSEGLSELRMGHELGSKQPGWVHPSGQWMRDAERYVALEPKLSEVLAGVTRVTDMQEQITLAQMCQYKKLNAAAARIYVDVLSTDPRRSEKLTAHGHDAASVAALAGCGQGNDADKLDDSERSRLRQQALEWLTAGFAACTKLADNPAEYPKVRQIMQNWQGDADFAGVRDADSLAKLPEAERVAWQKLWTDVADLLKRTEEIKAAEKPPPKP